MEVTGGQTEAQTRSHTPKTQHWPDLVGQHVAADIGRTSRFGQLAASEGGSPARVGYIVSDNSEPACS